MSIIPQSPPPGRQDSTALLSELQSEVSTEAAPLLDFILKHAGKIAAVVALFALVLAGTAGYNWYASRAADQARLELARLVIATQGQDKVKALESFAADAPRAVSAAALLALGDAALEVKDYDKAAAAFGRLAEADKDGALGLLAAYNQGEVLNRAGKYVEALAVFEKLENQIPEAARNTVRGVLAQTAVQAGRSERARTAFDALAASSAGPEAEYFRFRAQQLAVPAGK